MKTGKSGLALAASVMLAGRAWAETFGGMTRYTGATWVEAPYNDGDSFRVDVGGRVLHLRLYYVDAPETVRTPSALARRVARQRRHFGMGQSDDVLRVGREAATFTRQVLSKPFTVYTAFRATRGHGDRYYAFIRTSDGQDLGTLLVRAGLARAYGYTRRTPAGQDREAARRVLLRLEEQARLERVGAWCQPSVR